MLRRSAVWAVLVLTLTVSSAIGAPYQPQSKDNEAALDRVLRQMDSAGKKFVSFAAHFTLKRYTAVLKEFDIPDSGDFIYARAKDGSALLRQEVTQPGHRILTIKNSTLIIFQPKIKQAQVVNLGKNKDKAEFLAIGIGQSPAKLRDTFTIRYQGEESVNGSPCSALVLTPKNPAGAAYFSSITLWIKKATGVPIRQKLQEPSGDYELVDFTDEKLNTKVPDSKFEQKIPSGTEIQRLQ